MPIIAESPPLIFGGTPIPTAQPTIAPTVSPTISPTGTPRPITITSIFVVRHDEFINRIDGLSACFKRAELNDFTDQEFLDHSQIAMKDKYIVQEMDIYCSMQGINQLTKTLKRLGEE